MAEKPKESLADLKKGAYKLDPTVLGQAVGPALSESLLPEPGPPLSVEEWRARNEPGRFDPVEASIALVGGPRGGRGIRAYHSSPHDFERFDLGKIGTGEGHQTFGHGLYFAENPKVSGRGGQYWNQFAGRFPPAERYAAEQLRYAGFDREKAAEAIRQRLADTERFSVVPAAPGQLMGEREALRMLESGKPVGPRTYEVDINAQPEQFLNWERPLHQQPEAVSNVLVAQGGPLRSTGSGRAIYEQLGQGDKARASAALREAGVPGIRYLDQGSRSVGSKGGVDDLIVQVLDASGGDPKKAITELTSRIAGRNKLPAQYRANDPTLEQALEALQGGRKDPRTYNYAVWNDKIIDIAKKYGLVGAAGGAAATKGDNKPKKEKEGT